jgi:hypothetical protein
MPVATSEGMSTLRAKLAILAFASVAIASQACTLASPTTVEMKPADDGDSQDSDATESDAKTSTSTSSSAATTCSAKFVQPDLASLKACGNGKGHCYAHEKMNAAMQNFFAADRCTGGEVCVDDEFIKAGGKELTACKGIGGAGRCVVFELNAPMVATPEAVALKNGKSDCAAGLVCVPCVDPSHDNADTGICHPQGLLDAACTGGSTSTSTTTPPAKPAATCCGGKGTCLDGSGLGDSAKEMKQDSCSAGLVCAPQSLVSNKAVKCDAGFLGKGICMDSCFNDMLSGIGGVFLSQDACAQGEKCIPCTFASGMAPDGVTVPGCE